jgi:hypothetical protein
MKRRDYLAIYSQWPNMTMRPIIEDAVIDLGEETHRCVRCRLGPGKYLISATGLTAMDTMKLLTQHKTVLQRIGRIDQKFLAPANVGCSLHFGNDGGISCKSGGFDDAAAEAGADNALNYD